MLPDRRTKREGNLRLPTPVLDPKKKQRSWSCVLHESVADLVSLEHLRMVSDREGDVCHETASYSFDPLRRYRLSLFLTFVFTSSFSF